jgi:hypothetical protein
MSEKPKLKLDWCTHKAARYAVEHWHYSRRMPKSKLVKIGVWEDDVFIGVVIFGSGATPDLLNPYNLSQTEGAELVRVALKNHISPVSQIISRAIRLLKSQFPELKLIVSFADPVQKHLGIIYQAGNWIFNGESSGYWGFIDKNGKEWHPRNVWVNKKGPSKVIHKSQCEKIYKPGKYRYLYPLNKKIRKQIIKLAKPYPKNAAALENGSDDQLEKGGANPTQPLHI